MELRFADRPSHVIKVTDVQLCVIETAHVKIVGVLTRERRAEPTTCTKYNQPLHATYSSRDLVERVDFYECDARAAVRAAHDGRVARIARRKRGDNRRLVILMRRQGSLNLRRVRSVLPIIVLHADTIRVM